MKKVGNTIVKFTAVRQKTQKTKIKTLPIELRMILAKYDRRYADIHNETNTDKNNNVVYLT